MTRPTHCDLCGRALPVRTSKRGRPKTQHRECGMLQVRLIQVAGLLKVVRFDPPTRVESSNALLGHAKEVRSQLQDLWRGFTVKSVKQSTSSAEYHGVSDGN